MIRRARRGVRTLVLLSVVSAIVGCTKPEPPRVLRQITPFELTAQDGTSFGSEELAGTPYLVSFFFTSCSTVCPPVMEEMKSIQDELIARERIEKGFFGLGMPNTEGLEGLLPSTGLSMSPLLTFSMRNGSMVLEDEDATSGCEEPFPPLGYSHPSLSEYLSQLSSFHLP